MTLARTVGIRLLAASLERHTPLFFIAVLYPVMPPCNRTGLNPVQEVSKTLQVLKLVGACKQKHSNRPTFLKDTASGKVKY